MNIKNIIQNAESKNQKVKQNTNVRIFEPRSPARCAFRVILIAVSLIIAGMNLGAAVIVDDVGRKVEMRIPAGRIVCLSPAQTEMIYYLGAEKKLAGVSTMCDFPKEAQLKEKAGTFLNPDMEKIIKLKPDCVISAGGIQKKTIAKLEKLGIPVIVFYPRGIRGIKNDMQLIALITGTGIKSRRKIEEFNRAVDFRVPLKKKKRVYVELWPKPAMAVGGISYINELLNACGGENIISSVKNEYPRVSPEEIIKRDPEIIILLYDPGMNYRKDKRFSMTTAGRNNKIFIIKGDALDEILRPGPRIKHGLIKLRKIIEGDGA